MTGRIHTVVPTISPGRAEDVSAINSVLSDLGVGMVAVANSASAAAACREAGIPHLDFGVNLGFGEAINMASQHSSPWDWLLILNDDVQLDRSRFKAAIRILGDNPMAKLLFLDPEPWRPMPTRSTVFMTLSLLGGVRRKFARRQPAKRGYKSFSAVAISRSAWERVQGFDVELKFNYEDADFVRRAADAGVAVEAIDNAGVAHRHSATGRRYIDAVLPVSAWSSRVYLEKLGVSHLHASVLCLSALLVRLPLSLFVDGSRVRHVKGTLRSLAVVVGRKKPSLPRYEAI